MTLRAALLFVLPLSASTQFNRDVRPILSDKCYSCHGPDRASRKTAWRLDQESSARPHLEDALKRITSTNSALRMPPAYMGRDPLTAAEIDTIRKWIDEGAPYERHWSLIPPKATALSAGWKGNPIDYFLKAKSPRADRAALLRRVSLDLTGLPPSLSEIEAKEPYEKAVDRLLASPRYAERMAIEWLQAARYADSNGYSQDGARDMWRWRDWVIDAFHKNMPFDRFTVEQIAGDLIPNATLSQKIATGFNRNHRTSAEGGIVDEEFRASYVSDRVETTTTVWLGLTVGCARCHDHKYDPITQKEYYQLFAYFNKVPEKGFVYNFGNEEPYIKAPLPDQQKQLAALDAKVAAAREHLKELEPKRIAAQRAWEKALPSRDVDWTVTRGQVLHDDGGHFDGARIVENKSTTKFNYRDPFTFGARIRPEADKGAILSKSQDYWEGTGHGLYLVDGKLRLHVIFRWTDLGMRVETANPVKLNEWQHVLVTYDGSMKASGVRMYVDGRRQELKVLFDQCIWPLDTKEPFRIGAGGGIRFRGDIRDVRVYDRALPTDEAAVVAGVNPQRKLDLCFLEKFAPAEITHARAALEAAERERTKFYDTIPTVMVMQDQPGIRDTFVLKRGAYDQPGEKVTAKTPDALPPFRPEWPANRLGLARWMVDRDNPLTARVAVNRFWQMLFGTGLVKTSEDFGSQGDPPVNQELLDWLAVRFMDSGWDVKAMLRLMVTSEYYQQSAKGNPEWRTRLTPEMIRDQVLAWSGLLVEKVGGPSVKPYQPEGLWKELSGGSEYKADSGEGLYRRSLYTYWKRTVPAPSMVLFDAPNRETCVVRQSRTNTPLQALNLMNDTIFIEGARKIGERMMAEGGLPFGVRLVLAREPRPAELQILQASLDKFRAYYSAHPDEAKKFIAHGESKPDPRYEPGETAAYTAVASLLINMDEAITK